ncbi:hypothetical protein BMH32_03935 [Leucobacter sp. OLJS4]|uniref:hypothetical protein n=1 Tax=unclassified Leucobacter TaxID=2621730 RepID=UPI000C183287|nr:MULTISPECIES: hypothetical protein [unclassified Leucobacter]PIJ50172.1 hypothetical protein BMH30_04050 [Leucobacter sp. OLES1]PII82838.1 hypothetical protein BMH25_08860 [Leucobacter sp. OLCALW19]PII88054.1 hypothetical protein BMH26_07240 [Leucobacter sp. OLTLW20]PII91912.1 hypothetical protein BMH27_07325 [Leucobacter sp. OLAS13]PIJ00234.1 hypothetical protein BMH29_02610 [Leucobacter sp. OLDS2]
MSDTTKETALSDEAASAVIAADAVFESGFGAAGFADAESREILNLLGDDAAAGGSCCGGSCCSV